MTRLISWMMAILCLLVAAPARAEPTEEQMAAAQAAFAEGKRLVAAGEIAAGCVKLEESQRLVPGSGTLLNLADCYEQLGRTASAWSSFRATAAAARQKGNEERALEAEARATALEPRLVKLRVVVAEAARLPGLVITRDDTLLDMSLWDVALAVDPGEHRITARAPGYQPWSDTVTLPPTASVIEVSVPALGPPPPDPAPQYPVLPTPQPPVPAPNPGDAQRIFGVVMGAVGLIALGVGVGFGVDALNKKADSNDAGCSADNICPPDGLDLRDEAVTRAHVSTALFVAGLAHLASGAILLATAPSAPSSGFVFGWGARF